MEELPATAHVDNVLENPQSADSANTTTTTTTNITTTSITTATTNAASAPPVEATSTPTDDVTPSNSAPVFTLKRPRTTEPVTHFLNPPSQLTSPQPLSASSVSASSEQAVPPKQPRTDSASTPLTPRSPYANLPRKMPRKTPVSTPTSSLGTPVVVSPPSQSPAAVATTVITTPPINTPPAVTTAASRLAALHQRWATMLHDVLMKEREADEAEFVMALSLRIVEALPGNVEERKDGFQAILFGMKDVKNVELRRRVVEGDLLVEHLVRMDERQLANPELRKQIEDKMEERAKNTNMSELAKAMRTSNSTLFRCPSCGQRDTSWFQRQTRSGDEPMTVIITCNKCNTQWRKY